MSKTCNSCTKHSDEWNITKELAKANKRQFITIIVLIAILFVTVFGLCGGFIWYLNQYDASYYDVAQDGEWGNTFIGGENGGDITYGAEDTSTQKETERPQ